LSKRKVDHKIRGTKRTSEDSEIDQRDKTFVLFYATWCPFSQRFLPVFEEYARTNPEECLTVIVDERPDLCDKYGIEYYPTVLLLRNGRVDKRLDAEPGVGLNSQQLASLVKNT